MPTLGAGFDIFKATMSLQKVITRWRSMWTWFHGWISCSWRLSLRIGNFKLQRVRDKRPRCCSLFSELCDMRTEKAVAPHSSTLAWKIHGQRSLVGCSPWGREESDTTEQLHFHFSLLCIGEGNGNPLQCSCLENPRDGGACWAAVYGIAQSRTRLKQLNSSSSNRWTKTLGKSLVLNTLEGVTML